MAANTFPKINKAALAEVRTHKKLFIVTFILLSIGAVMYGIMSSFYKQYGISEDMSRDITTVYSPSWFAVLLLAGGAFIGIFSAVNIFRDMTNQQICDVQHSLPMSGVQRYFSKLLAMCYIHIFPVFIFSGIAAITGGILCSSNHVNGELNLKIFISLITAALFTDAMTIVCTCCCGAFAESIYFTLIMMFCTSIMPVMLYNVLIRNFAGFDMYDVPHFIGIWSYSFVALVEDLNFVFYGIINCLISAAVMLLTVFIYKKRDASTVGTPIVSRFFFELMLIMGVFTVYSIMLFEIEAVYGLVVVAIIYIVIHIVVSRAKLNLKSFMVWLLKYAATSAVFIVFMGAAYMTGCFGLAKKLPAENLDHAFLHIDVDCSDRYNYNSVSFNCYDFGAYKEALESDESRESLRTLSTLNDKQVREACRIVQNKYLNRKKTVSDYISMLYNGDMHLLRKYGYDNTAMIYISVIKPVSEKNKSPYEVIDPETKWYEQDIFEQSFALTYEECKELTEELRSLGYLYEDSADVPQGVYEYD